MPGCEPASNGITWIVTFGRAAASRSRPSCPRMIALPPTTRRTAASSVITHNLGGFSLSSSACRAIRAVTRLSISSLLA